VFVFTRLRTRAGPWWLLSWCLLFLGAGAVECGG
jgi:hypothetical protein